MASPITLSSVAASLPRFGFSRALQLAAHGRLDPEQQEALFAGFQVADALGASSEGAVHREVGASFNPRPSRLCQLLLLESNERTLSALLTAAFSCAPVTALQRSQSDSSACALYHVELERALEVSNILSLSPSSEPAKISEPDACIVLAHGLDILRHLHMSSLTAQQAEEECTRWQYLLSATGQYSQAERLALLVRACLDRMALARKRRKLA